MIAAFFKTIWNIWWKQWTVEAKGVSLIIVAAGLLLIVLFFGWFFGACEPTPTIDQKEIDKKIQQMTNAEQTQTNKVIQDSANQVQAIDNSMKQSEANSANAKNTNHKGITGSQLDNMAEKEK